jgi:hypothetical protein
VRKGVRAFGLKACADRPEAPIFWRHRRLLTAEGAAIRAGSEFIEQDEKQRQFAEAGEIMSSCASGLIREKTNLIVLEKCLGLLEELGDAIEGNGFNLARDGTALTTLCGPCEEERLEETLFDIYRLLSTAASVPDVVREQAKFSSPEAYKKEFLKELSCEEFANIERRAR